MGGLKRLEYRGYGSSWIAGLNVGNLEVIKKAGRSIRGSVSGIPAGLPIENRRPPMHILMWAAPQLPRPYLSWARSELGCWNGKQQLEKLLWYHIDLAEWRDGRYWNGVSEYFEG